MKNKEFELHKSNKYPYFEGWYIRCQQEDVSFAIIFGIHQTVNEKFAFIQFMDTISKQSIYEVFQENQIAYQEAPFQFNLGQNIFTKSYVYIHIGDVEVECKIRELTPLSSSWYMPSIMGPFHYIRMQCVHAVLSLHHDVTGYLKIADTIRIIDGIGYMEKDRGTSFPKRYVWFQANQLHKESCLFLSIASIPLGIINFMGIIAVFTLHGVQYRFATYLGARIKECKVERQDNQIHVFLVIQQFNMRLVLHLIQHEVCSLQAPYAATMHLKIKESLTSVGHMVIQKGNKQLYEEDFCGAGMEVVGFDV